MNVAKPILAIAMSFLSLISTSQSDDNQIIESPKSNSVVIESNHPDIELKSWDEKGIKMESTVKINGEVHNGAYTLQTENNTTGIYIVASVNTESLKKKVIVTNEDGSKSYFDTKGFQNLDYNENYDVTLNIGYNIEAKVVIWVPKRMNVETSTVYGDIYSKGSYATLKLNSTYGMIEAELDKLDKMEKVELVSTYDIVDLTVDPKMNADLKMSTSHGEVYSDLNLESVNSTQKNHCGSSGRYKINGGGGMKINLVSTYDNIYLRSKKSL